MLGFEGTPPACMLSMGVCEWGGRISIEGNRCVKFGVCLLHRGCFVLRPVCDSAKEMALVECTQLGLCCTPAFILHLTPLSLQECC